MTKRLYYNNAYQHVFEARVCKICEFRDQPAILLDQSYFYPTSGGQQFDTGALGGVPVVDVVIGDDSDIYHLLAEHPAAIEVGQLLHAEIDWNRRYDHMQQHAAQHLLSQIFYSAFGLETLSVHFGDMHSTIDFDTSKLRSEQLATAEEEANSIVYENRPIKAYFVVEDEIDKVPLRKPPKVEGTIRIVEIEDFDYSACGGTHCRSTAEVGPIKVLRQERSRGNTRVTFLAGHRARADYGQKHQLLMEAAGLFSTDLAQVPALTGRTLEQVKALQNRVDALQAELLQYEAVALRQSAKQVGDYTIVMRAFTEEEHKDVNALKMMANLLQAHPKTIVLLATVANDKCTAVFARSDDLPIHMGNLLRTTLQEFGGGGGGRPEFAQGGGVAPEKANDLLIYAAEVVQKIHITL